MRYKTAAFLLFISSLLTSCEESMKFSVDESEYDADGEIACIPSCAFGEFCKNGVCVKESCQNGIQECNGTQPMKCVDHEWTVNGSVCGDGTLCSEGKCRPINENCQIETNRMCIGLQPYICKDGKWQEYGDPCPNNRTCKGGSCTLSGIPCPDLGEQKLFTCEDNSENSGILYECVDSVWMTQKPCTNAFSCTGYGNRNTMDGLCGQCINDTYQCLTSEEKKITYLACKNGTWIDMGICNDKCSTEKGCYN